MSTQAKAIIWLPMSALRGMSFGINPLARLPRMLEVYGSDSIAAYGTLEAAREEWRARVKIANCIGNDYAVAKIEFEGLLQRCLTGMTSHDIVCAVSSKEGFAKQMTVTKGGMETILSDPKTQVSIFFFKGESCTGT